MGNRRKLPSMQPATPWPIAPWPHEDAACGHPVSETGPSASIPEPGVPTAFSLSLAPSLPMFPPLSVRGADSSEKVPPSPAASLGFHPSASARTFHLFMPLGKKKEPIRTQSTFFVPVCLCRFTFHMQNKGQDVPSISAGVFFHE